ncbi:MAG: inositol monophosphatase [Deltaproteobacteria bacterium]|nr:inositol monophosphatase [Deltaproteobacteria bacterium]
MKDFLKIAEEACRLSGQIQLDGLKKARDIQFKGDINLVTDIDHACEKAIVEKIQGTYPHHDILAEEGSGNRKDSEYKWIIDPLDGTTNYTHGYPLFCTSIALEHQGEIVMGAVYEPNLDEMFLAERGQGATLNGEKIQVSRSKSLNESLVATGFFFFFRESERNNIREFQRILLKARALRRDGVAAVDLCYVACGRYDAFWELNLFPWDVAAGFLMIEEAGGKVTDYQGQKFEIYFKEILASNGYLQEEMKQILLS